MQKKVLFIIPPITEKLWCNHYYDIYLGLAYIANLVHRDGHKIKVIDCDAEFHPLLSLKKKIKEYSPDIVGISAIYGSINNAFKIAKTIKNSSNANVVMGGLAATFLTEYVLKNSETDIAVRGEGELTFKDIIRGKKPEEIEGISFRKGREIVHNKQREFLQDLDILGYPLRHIFPLHKYKLPMTKHIYSTTIETARGCPYGCTFCVQGPKEGRKLRFRSPEMVIKEMKHIAKQHPFIRRIMIVDNDFLTNQEHAKKILREIIKNGLNKKFFFMIATRVNNIFKGKKELLFLLHKANVRTIYFGMESLSEKYRHKIGKIESVKRTYYLFRHMESLGMEPFPSYVFGFPEETKNDMYTTLEFAKKLDTLMFSFNVLTPYPNTPLYQQYLNQDLIVNHNYNQYDNSHKIVKSNFNIEKNFIKFHRKYMLYEGIIKLLFSKKNTKNRQKLKRCFYYLIFYEGRTHLRNLKRGFKKTLLRRITFEV